MTFKKITDSGDDVISGIKRIVNVRLVAGSDAATAVLFDGTQVAGSDFCKLSAPEAAYSDSEILDVPVGATGLGVTLGGSSPILYVYYE